MRPLSAAVEQVLDPVLVAVKPRGAARSGAVEVGDDGLALGRTIQLA